MSLTGLRLAARLSRREVRRRPWRTLLVALLVAGPVAGMTMAVVLVRTDQLSLLERWRLANGRADAVLGHEGGASSPGRDDAVPGEVPLPPGSRALAHRTDYRLVRTSTGRQTRVEVTDLPLADPLAQGIVRFTGRAPARAGEVLVSTPTARKLGVGIGDRMTLERPIATEVTVVGIGERADATGQGLLVLHRDASFPERRGTAPSQTTLVDLPDRLTTEQLEALGSSPGVVVSPALAPFLRDIVPPPSQSSGIRWSWFGGAVVLTIMGIVIASAFAAGARRQLTTLGQLAANGASPRTLRRVLVLEGTWTGLVGAVVGLGLGAAGLAALAPHRDRLLGLHVPTYDVQWGDLVPVVLLGILAASLAALVPARSASRIPVLAALAGRRPLAPVPPWLTITGVAVGAGGLGLMGLATLGATSGDSDGDVVWVLAGITGAMALLLGVCAVAPGYVSVLGPVAARLGGSWRLASRSLARQRSRTGAVVAAVCASAALAVAASAIIQAAEVADDRSHLATDRVIVSSRAHTPEPMLGGGGSNEVIRPAAPEVVAAMRTILIDPEVVQQHWVDLGEDGRTATVADADLLDTYGFGREVGKALDGAGLVAVDQPGEDVPITVPRPGREPRTLLVPVVPRARTSAALPPAFLITPPRVAELGLVPQPGDVILRQSRALTGDQRVAVEAALEVHRDEQVPESAAGPDTSSFTFADLYLPPSGPDPLVLDAALGAIALVFTLFVVATSLALAAAETRDERDVLTVVGASPGTIRRTSGAKALIVSAFGVALALPVGLLPVLLYTRVDPSEPPFVFPWRVVALLLVGIPVLAGLATTATSALALRLRPVRTSTMAFE